jgi:1-phosphofructokinase family hexose kinase
MILSITPNPCVDKTIYLDKVEIGTFMRAPRVSCVAGGKGCNVARAATALGTEAEAMVIVGGPPGQHVVDMIEHDDNVRCIPIWVKSMTRTITTVLEESIHRQTAFFEPGPKVTLDEMDRLLATLRAVVKHVKVVTMNGTVPDPAIQSLYAEVITICNEEGVKTILDAHGPEFREGIEAKPYLIKPNVAEAQQYVGFELNSLKDRLRAIDQFHEEGIEIVVMSLGKEGALLSSHGMRWHAVPPSITEVNPVGSGDSLVAGLAIGLHEGWAMEDALRLGAAAGTANAMNWDIGHFDVAEVERLKAKVVLKAL